mmetsp:Transcript_10655/g.15895  ORF Transcript_10655/g.15895 Transcript_10655/m.15895 type:complete len:152 (-) Transcript_10655:109-564(-)|eukprot:CAMPEP_0167755950 /NCGR_PEP_ID=MMETSP0110_2-20121227/9103_1 /TAXON_ID=629695 /ORGANISM="Gymnochlora sp., Strain CCMP2014" /LENGTH=151 /DNA_ID=CAMNT_0007641983 /DNA_START=31 /DNA_END=486 /DNA_ORIENTATION=-
MAAAKKLLKEYKEFEDQESDKFEVSNPQDDGDILHWEVLLFGPADGPYEEGMFFVDIVFENTYPDSPPKSIKMKTKIYHPNIDKKGNLCIGQLKKSWNNKMNVKTIIDYMIQILEQPDADDGLNAEVAQEMTKNKEKYLKTAKEWTQKYAT